MASVVNDEEEEDVEEVDPEEETAARNGEPRRRGGIGPSVFSGPLIGLECLLEPAPGVELLLFIIIGICGERSARTRGWGRARRRDGEEAKESNSASLGLF